MRRACRYPRSNVAGSLLHSSSFYGCRKRPRAHDFCRLTPDDDRRAWDQSPAERKKAKSGLLGKMRFKKAIKWVGTVTL